MQDTDLQQEKSKGISATRLKKCGGVAEEKLSGKCYVASVSQKVGWGRDVLYASL